MRASEHRRVGSDYIGLHVENRNQHITDAVEDRHFAYFVRNTEPEGILQCPIQILSYEFRGHLK